MAVVLLDTNVLLRISEPEHPQRIVAAMIDHGIESILTFNIEDFKRYMEITVIDPATVAASGS